MNRIHSIFFILCVLLCSCHHSSEPIKETALPISEEYLPSTVRFSADDSEWKAQIKEWADKKLVVNDISELPDDPFGFSEAYSGINFKEFTLLITYNIHNYTIDTYRNRYYRENATRTYNWAVCIKTANRPDDSAESLYFSRYAILVKKIPEDANVNIWFSLGALNWGWE